MKIWTAKRIVSIHRKQIVSKFSINCTYKRAFLLAKAHNPAVDTSDPGENPEEKESQQEELHQ